MANGSHHETQAYYDEFSDWYERGRQRGYHALIDDLEIAIAEPFARERRVLEVGCGTGLILERLTGMASFAAGLDLSSGMLAKAHARGLPVVLGSATALPFADESFDLVYSFKVLAHVPEIGLAMREMARVVAPGGVVLAEFYNPWSLRYLAKRLGGPGAISAAKTEAEVYTRYDSPQAIQRLVPPGMTLEGLRGVRTVVPFASALQWPLVGSMLRAAEFAVQDTALARFAGFVVAVLRK